LGDFLDGAMDPEEQRQQRWRELNVFFRAWIVENCPPD